MNKLQWQTHYNITNEEMDLLFLLIKEFNGKIVSVNDYIINKKIELPKFTGIIKGIGAIKNTKKTNKR